MIEVLKIWALIANRKINRLRLTSERFISSTAQDFYILFGFDTT